jgi:hypothetical protein
MTTLILLKPHPGGLLDYDDDHNSKYPLEKNDKVLMSTGGPPFFF